MIVEFSVQHYLKITSVIHIRNNDYIPGECIQSYTDYLEVGACLSARRECRITVSEETCNKYFRKRLEIFALHLAQQLSHTADLQTEPNQTHLVWTNSHGIHEAICERKTL